MSSNQTKKRRTNKKDENIDPNVGAKETEDDKSETRSFKCLKCTKGFVNNDKLDKHIRRKHINDNNLETVLEDENEIQSFNCNKCTKVFTNSDKLGKHIRRKHSDESDSLKPVQETQHDKAKVKIVSNDDVNAIESNKRETRSFNCSKCTKGFVNRDKLDKHIRRKHINDNNLETVLEDEDEIQSFNCNKCTKVFTNSDRLGKHTRRKHPDESDSLKPVQENLHDKTKVEIVLSDEVNEIESNKSETRSFNCSKCTKGFFTYEKLEKHIRRKHVEERTLKIRLNVEANTKHSKCPECSVIVLSSNLKKHMRRKHLDPTKKFQCEECSKLFYTNKELKDHQIIHKDAGGREHFVCDQCFSIFTRKDNLKKHKDHCSEVQHERISCNLCDKKFSSKSSLGHHIRRVHDGIKNMKCDVCQRGFIDNCNLERHVTSVHDVVTEHECPICPTTYFPFKRNLAQHLKSYHSDFVVPGHAFQS